MDEIRTQVAGNGNHTLFFGCVVISDLNPEDAKAFASARERRLSPRMPKAMPLRFFVDFAAALRPQQEQRLTGSVSV